MAQRMIFAVVILQALLVSGCVTPSTMMVNREGRLIRCAASGWGYGIAGAVAMSAAEQTHDRCVDDAMTIGFIPIPKAAIGFNLDTKSNPMKIVELTDKASAAGMKIGDQVLSIDNRQIDGFFSVIRVLNTKKPGDSVNVVLQRGEEKIPVKVFLVERREGIAALHGAPAAQAP